ncbi:MAG: MarR family transcriptional regulator [Promethearchaeota archaeon]
MENYDYNYYLNDCKNPSDFLIKPKNFNDINFKKLCNLVDTCHLAEINVFNFLYEEFYVSKSDLNLIHIVEKMDYYPSTLSKNLKRLIKKNYIELYLVNGSKQKKIAVKFTKQGLDQIKLIRDLFLQCKNCKKLYLYPILENFNDADDNYCSYNCRYKSKMEKSVQKILNHEIS